MPHQHIGRAPPSALFMIPRTAGMRAAHSGNTGVAAAAQSSGAVLLPPASLTAARLLYATAGAAGHDSPGHPECAARVPAILEALETHGLTARSSGVLELTGFSAAPRPAVQLVHAAGYVAGLERASATSAERERAIDLDGSTYCTASTSSDACLVSLAWSRRCSSLHAQVEAKVTHAPG